MMMYIIIPNQVIPKKNGQMVSSNFIIKVCAVFVAIFFCGCFFAVRLMFGTFSIPEAVTIYKKVKELEEKYTNLFNQRDNTMYHIGSARVIKTV